ncbi:hypothetical protein ACE1BJ_15915, partial [Aeromonas jandaei]
EHESAWLPALGYMSLRAAKRDISYYLMDYYNWRRPHQHNDGIPPARAEDRPNQVSGFRAANKTKLIRTMPVST